jgi:hypothetical protein
MCDVLEYPRKEKARDAAGLFRKLSASPFWRLGDGAIQPASILAMSGSLALRSPERVVHSSDQHAEI